MKLLYFLFFLYFMRFGNTFAAEISFENLLDSVYKHHPVILQELDKINSATAQVKEKEGYFDLKLKAEYQKRTEGKYKGGYQKISLEKSIPDYNIDLYTAFRKSDKAFPIYEQELSTLDEGEVSLGLKLSLLRYRLLDQERLELNQSILGRQTALLNYQMIKDQLKFYVMQIYVNWYYSGKSVEVYEQLLEFSEQQAKALKIRVKNGDLPRIYLVENKQYLLKRKNQLQNAKQKFYKLTYQLSLLWRNNQGVPIFITSLPAKIPLRDIYAIKFNPNETIDFQASEMIKKLNNDLELINFQISDAKNKLLPKFDIDLKYAKDNGATTMGDDTAEKKVMFSFEFPIERNLGEGAISKYKAKKLAYQKKLIFVKEKILAKFKATTLQLQSTLQMIQNYKEEFNVADQMRKAEKIKFNGGGSDYFLLNLREQNMALAQINLFKARIHFALLYSEYSLLKKGLFPGTIF